MASKLPFWRTLFDALRITFKGLGTAYRMGRPLMAVVLVVLFVVPMVLVGGEKEPNAAVVFFMQALIVLVGCAVGAHFAVRWHRYVLLGHNKTPRRTLDWLAGRYFLPLTIITVLTEGGSRLLLFLDPLITSIPGGPAINLLFAILYFSMVAVVFLTTTFLPAVALGARALDVTQAWSAARGSRTRAVILIAIANAIIYAEVQGLLTLGDSAWLREQLDTILPPFAAILIGKSPGVFGVALLAPLVLALSLTTMSLIYAHIVAQQGRELSEHF